MPEHVRSLKGLVETALTETFTRQMTNLYDDLERDFIIKRENLEKEFRYKWESEKERLKKQLKKDANALTLDLMQKSDINGISVEFKL